MKLWEVIYYTLSDCKRVVTVPAADFGLVEHRTRKIHDDVFQIISVREIMKTENSIYCKVCEDHIKINELIKETHGAEWVHSICPGCGSELLEPYLPF